MNTLARVQTLWELFIAGGLLMWPIVAMSLVVVTFGIERLVALRGSRCRAVGAARLRSAPPGGESS